MKGCSTHQALRSSLRLPSAMVLLLVAALLVPWAATAFGDRNAAALAAMADLAGGRSGAVVWQSRSAGSVRIFACDLDGSNLRQLSPDVASRDHLAPLISPDGTRVLYYQPVLPMSDATYYSDHYGDMMLVDIDDTNGSSARSLQQNVRTYFECRFARWLDNDRIAFIGQDHDGYVHTVSTGTSEKLFDYPYADFGAIPNRQLSYAIDGENRVFEIANPGPGGTLVERQDYDGCEGNLSWDGLWAYRVKGGYPGHDFTRMRLGNWSLEQVFFANENSTLPADQNYIYYPQLSLDQRWLGLGVSCCREQHSHWDGDYDIFVVPIDPATFQATADPVKYSFSTALDSYPDIWVAPATPPVLDAIEISPASASVRPGGSLDLTATLLDQRGAPFAATVSWSVSGGGTVAPTTSGGAVTSHQTRFSSNGSTGEFTVVAAASGVQGTATITVAPVILPLRINCGSNDYDVAGWERDDVYVSGGQDWTNPNDVDTSGVADAAPALVYKSVRHLGPHAYDLPVPDGVYLLRLHFADAFADRDMDYFVEGLQILDGFDIASEAGGVNRALVKTFTVAVSDGNGLQIEPQSVEDVFEAGLELIPVTGVDAGIADARQVDRAVVGDAAGRDAGVGVDAGVNVDAGARVDAGASADSETGAGNAVGTGCGCDGAAQAGATTGAGRWLVAGLALILRSRARRG